MRVGIIGGGIAGLTAAHLLSGRSDVEVEVFEAESVFGGRANVTKDGEHCTRFFLDDYHHLLAILQTIPQSDGTLYDRLTATRRLVLGRAGNWIDADHMYAFLSRDSVPIRDKVAISNANRRSLLVARRAERDRYASVWNWSPPALLRALRASTPASGHPVAFPGPTDTYFVNPWVAHLRDRGVLLHCSSPVISFSERHDGVEIRTPAASVNFDVVIVTAFAPDAYALLDRSGVARPLDRRTHTHCKCLTIRLAPNEPILSDPTLRAYSWAGVTAVVQPTHQRCVMLAAYAATSDTTTLLTQLRNNLPLRHELIEVQVRDNLALNEAVFFGTQVQPAVLESALQGRVFFAGSYLANSYAVDSAEGACRTAVHAVARATECHPSLMRAPRLSPGALPPANMRQRVPVVAHPNSPRTGADGLWRLVRIVNRVATPLPARIQFLYLDAFDWDPEQPAVYVANHRSIFDVPAGILAFDRLKVFPRLIIAERYFKGATGLALNTLGAIPAVRGSDATISAAVAAVRAGESVAFMVEGRVTSPEEAVSAAHGRGAFEVACRTGVPVIPIGGSGTHEVWATARAWPLVRRRRPLVTIAIGAAEHPGDDSCEGLAKRVRDGLHVLERTAEKYPRRGGVMEIFDPADMPRPIAFVFGGGASATAAQVGMLKAAVEFGLKPDLVIGTSAGALNGALLADDPHTAVERLTDIWTSLDRRSALPDSLVRQVLNIRRREHWFADHGLRALFTAHLEARDFADLEIPFACVATDLADGSIALLDTGDIESALLASCALPGIFPVVRRGDRLLIDGGCVAYVPARQAVDFGARSLVIMDGRPGVMPPRKHEHVDVRDTVAVAFAAALESQCRAELELAAQLVPTVNLAGRPDRHVGAFDFGHGAELITSAYEAAVRDLEFRAIQRNPSHRLTDGHIANHTGYAQA